MSTRAQIIVIVLLMRRRAVVSATAVFRRCGRRAVMRHLRNRMIDQAAHLQRFGGLNQRMQSLLRHADLAAIHEIDDGLHHPAAKVLQHNHRMLARRVGEHALEERRARGQNDLVRSDARLGADERHVDERFGLEQRIEGAQDVVLVIVPPQAVMLRLRHGVGGGWRR